MTRKQHIENLERLKGEEIQLIDGEIVSLQYAIDHLSREWVSRRTHRKLQKELKLSEAEQVRLMKDKNKQKAEVDQLKIDKDMLQTALESQRNLLAGSVN